MGGTLRDALQRLGAPRVEATLLAALLEHGPLETKAIVAKTRLRQPEVSVGMQELRDRGWVAVEPQPRQGKGRPMNRYRLEAEVADIRAHFEAIARKAIADYEQSLKLVHAATA